MLRHANGASARRAHHQNPALGGFVQINVVHANAGAAHNPQPRRVIQQRGGNFGGAAHDQRIGISQFRVQIVFGGENYVPAGLLQEFNSAVADLVRNNNLHDSSIPGKSRGERKAVSSHVFESMISKNSKLLCGAKRVKSPPANLRVNLGIEWRSERIGFCYSASVWERQ